MRKGGEGKEEVEVEEEERRGRRWSGFVGLVDVVGRQDL